MFLQAEDGFLQAEGGFLQAGDFFVEERGMGVFYCANGGE